MLDYKTCRRAGITVVIVFLIIHYWNNLMGVVQLAIGAAGPLIMGCIIAYVVNILMDFYEIHMPKGKYSKRLVAMILAYISVVLVVFLIIGMIVPELKDSIELLVNRLPGRVNASYRWVEENLPLEQWMSADTVRNLENNILNIDWKDIIQRVTNWFSSGVGNAVTSVISLVSSILSLAITGLIAFIFSIYLLTGKERLSRQIVHLMRTYVKDKWTDKILYVLGVFNNAFHHYIVGQCIEAAILGALCTVGMFIFRFPYATMVGCLVGFTALIPMAGAYIGAIVGAFMIFTISPVKALLFIIYLAILQQLEGNIIYPRVVGASIGLPGIWVLAAVTIGGGVLGVGGMLLGVPLAAGLYQLVKADVHNRG